MLTQIERIYKSGFTKVIFINTDYVIKIEEVEMEEGLHPFIKTRWVVDSLSYDGPDILYCSYELNYIKGLITRRRNATKKKA